MGRARVRWRSRLRSRSEGSDEGVGKQLRLRKREAVAAREFERFLVEESSCCPTGRVKWNAPIVGGDDQGARDVWPDGQGRLLTQGLLGLEPEPVQGPVL